MTQPASTTSVGSTGTAIASDNPTNPASMMGENDFLKLLVAQLQYQDPMNPTDNNQFMQEQAQFSTVEGINNLEKTMTAMQSQQQLAQSVSLIGKQVAYVDAKGNPGGGVVSSVSSASDGTVTVKVGGVDVDPSTIVGITNDPTAADEQSTLLAAVQQLLTDQQAAQQAAAAGTGTTTTTTTTAGSTGA